MGLVERRVVSRGRWSNVWLVLVLAFSSGATMAAIAGGRRATTSFDRFLSWSDEADLSMHFFPNTPPASADADLTRAAGLPQVEAATRFVLIGDGVSFRGRQLPFLSLQAAAVDTLHPIGRVKMIDGRLADPSSVSEAMVGFDTAGQLGIRVGDTLQVIFGTRDDNPTLVPSVEAVTIVGILAMEGSFPTLTSRPDPVMMLTPAFQSAHAERVDWTNGGLDVKLRRGKADVAAYRAAIEQAGLPITVSSIHDFAVGVRRVMRVEAGALWWLALVVAGASAVVVSQSFRRQSAAASKDVLILSSLGLRRTDIARVGAWHGVRVGMPGAVVGALVAVVASPLLPIGIARTADPDPGLHADLTVLIPGAVVTVAIVSFVGAATLLLASRTNSSRPQRPSMFSSIISRLSPVPSTGTRLAVAPTTSGPGASFRLGLLGLGSVMALMVAALAMQASFERVLTDPALSGSTWDMSIGYDFDHGTEQVAAMQLASDPLVAGFARGGWDCPLLVDGKRVYVVHLEPGTLLSVATDRGRAPIAPDEIALGAAEMKAIGVGIGDTVELALSPDECSPWVGVATISAEVTGRAVLSSPIYEPLGQGGGGAVTIDLMRRLIGADFAPRLFFIRLHEGADLESTTTLLAEHLPPGFSFNRPDRTGVTLLRDLRNLPSVLVALLALLASAALLYRLVMANRIHRRDLAVLRSIGLTDRQVLGAGATHGGVVVMLTLAGAIPVGLLLGAVVWRRVASYLAVVSVPEIPMAAIGIVAAVGAVLGVVAGILVVGRARRGLPGMVLRTE